MSFRIGCKNNKIGPAARFQKVMQNGKPAKMNSVIVDSDTVVISCPGGLVVRKVQLVLVIHTIVDVLFLILFQITLKNVCVSMMSRVLSIKKKMSRCLVTLP